MMKVTVKSEPTRAHAAQLDPRDERALLAAVCGWMSAEERRDFDARLAADANLAREFERRQAAWNGVEDPPEVRLPWGFGRRLSAQALAERAADRELARDWRNAPGWARLAAAAALVCGVAFGWALAPNSSTPTPALLAETRPEVQEPVGDPVLADNEDLLEAEDLFGDTSPSLWEALASGEDTAGTS